MSVPVTAITLRYDPEFADLWVKAVDGEFRGTARAALPLADIPKIQDFIAKLRIYPLKRCSLTLSYAEFVRLTAFQEDIAGHVVLVVELGEGTGPDQNMVRIAMRQDWAALKRFSEELARMMQGDLDRIELRAEVR